jgi:hypothetical protein
MATPARILTIQLKTGVKQVLPHVGKGVPQTGTMLKNIFNHKELNIDEEHYSSP